MESPSLHIKEEVKKIKEEIQSVPIDHVPLQFVHSLLNSRKYTDPYFPPTLYIVYGDKSKRRLDCEIIFKRPETFMKKPISVFTGGIEESDILQGKLGDCWLMSSLCALTERKEAIEKIFCTKEYSVNGIYRLQLYKNGELQYVTIDDYIPCDAETNKPVFSKNNGSELWVLLIEKAYAKLHGSYLSLKGGYAEEAFIDITGWPAFTYYFDQIEDKINSGEFWRMLNYWHSQRYCLVAATSGEIDENSGMVSGHYYSIRDVVEVHGNYLLQLRNPWGSFEWQGAWSDNSREWTPEMINALHPVFDKSDGQFWMCYQDFLYYFQRVVMGKTELCYERREKNWMIKNPSHGAVAYEYYTINVATRTEVTLGIHQEDERCVGTKQYRRYLDLGIVVIRWEVDKYVFFASTEKNLLDRQVQLELTLDPGYYVVLPISGGCSFRVPEGEKHLVPLLTETDDLHPIFQSTIKDIFRRFDSDMDGILSARDFIGLAARIGQRLSEAQFYNAICQKYTSTERGVSLQGLYELFLVGIEAEGEEAVRRWVTQLGHDEYFYSIESKPVVFTLHSKVPVDMNKALMSPNYNILAWGLLAEAKGKEVAMMSGIKLYTVTHSNGTSFIAKSNAVVNKKVTLDLNDSTNVNYAIGNGVITVEMETGHFAILEHAQCSVGESTYTYSYSFKAKNN
ncbi:unnamed protein product [Blepharisma stoltei]|uniref:Uncharacterized protein n=1 Tax=Blepharisma stoltei TaxID=1481888 RepID=A0AAU9J5E8_9CILI|nr:unnamed protein product [Blepharisma stoltei]